MSVDNYIHISRASIIAFHKKLSINMQHDIIDKSIHKYNLNSYDDAYLYTYQKY